VDGVTAVKTEKKVVAEPGQCGRWCVTVGVPSLRRQWRRHPWADVSNWGALRGDSSPVR
jgi:hypothetical protein